MSIRIEPSDLADRLEGRDFAYLVTTGGERAHVVASRCTVEAGRVTVSRAGRTTLANVAATSNITLVWPPTSVEVEHREYSVVADGRATIVDGDVIEVSVTNAVFHRPAT